MLNKYSALGAGCHMSDRGLNPGPGSLENMLGGQACEHVCEYFKSRPGWEIEEKALCPIRGALSPASNEKNKTKGKPHGLANPFIEAPLFKMQEIQNWKGAFHQIL